MWNICCYYFSEGGWLEDNRINMEVILINCLSVM